MMRNRDLAPTADELLAIDVAAEIRLLGAAQLQGPWQLPTELVRYALQRGADRVELRLKGRGFEVADDGEPISFQSLEALVSTLKTSLASVQRQHALESLEAAGGVPLLWAVTLARGRLEVLSVGDGGGGRLGVRAGAARLTPKSPRPGVAGGVRIKGRLGRDDIARAMDAVVERCRFASAEITLNGRSVVRGFPGGMYRMRFSEPVEGAVALTSRADAPRLWLLQNGVVSSRATLPGYPPFEAAIELGGVAPEEASPAELRSAVAPYLRGVVDHGMSMMVRLARRVSELDDAARDRLSDVLLRAAEASVWRARICRLPLIPTIEGSGGISKWLSIDQLRDTENGSIPVVSTVREPESVSEFGGRVLVLPVSLRGRVANLAGKRLIEAVKVKKRRGVKSSFHGLLGRLRFAWNRRLQVRDLGPIVADAELEQWELRALAVLRDELSTSVSAGHRGVHLCEGSGFPTTRRGLALVPRYGPARPALVHAGNGLEGAVYPVVVALAEESGVSSTELRARWVEYLNACGMRGGEAS